MLVLTLSQKLLSTATQLKETGNKHFTAKPQRLDAARESYLSALDSLPDCQREREPAPAPEATVEEVDDDATVDVGRGDDDSERIAVEEGIRECTKAVWGNLGAVYVALVSVVWPGPRPLLTETGPAQGGGRGVHQRFVGGNAHLRILTGLSARI